MQKTSNPLRISQESLDLDDIISDLNSEVGSTQPVQVAPPEIIKPSPLLSIEGSKKQVTSKAKTTTKVIEPEKPKQTAVKSKGNKENDSTLFNTQTVTKSMMKGDATLAHHTTETKAQSVATNENNRYGESLQKSSLNMFSDVKPYDEEEEVDQNGLRMMNTMPFYLKNNKATNDEDVESFQRRLDTLIVNFRGETMAEFMRTKKQLNNDQAQTLDAERRRFNTLLGVKQNEIEQLKESLAQKTKSHDELNTRCEVMAIWAGKAKTLLRIKFLQSQAFNALKSYRDFTIHSRRVLEHKTRQFKENLARKAFQGWQKQFKAWKIVKDRETFEKSVKLELQHICAQYNKEIESLREKLNEANVIVENEHRNKALMSENLKKAFMRGVCALNFEAMHILNPNDQGRIEMELEKQVANAMTSLQGPFNNSEQPSLQSQRSNAAFSQNFYENQFSPKSSESNEISRTEPNERQMDNPFVSLVSHHDIIDYKKVESKDSMWKPAPIMGREMVSNPVPMFSYNQPTITSQLRGTQQLQSNVVLPSQFAKNNSDIQQVMASQPAKMEEEMVPKVRVLPGNPTVIQNSSSLPDFVSNNAQVINSEGGRTIVANQPKLNATSAKLTSTVANKKPTTPSVAFKKPTTTK